MDLCLLMHMTVLGCSQVLLCEETVSLLGIRQYYKLIGDSSSSSSGGGTVVTTAPTVGVEAGLDPSSANGTEQQQPQQQQHKQPQQQQEQQQQPDEQELLQRKVDGLLQLLSSVTYHQVGMAAQAFHFI